MLFEKKLTYLPRKPIQKNIWSQKKISLKNAYFGGHPVIQAVEAKMHEPIYKNSYFYKISHPIFRCHFYPLLAQIIGGGGYKSPPPWVLSFGKRTGSFRVKDHQNSIFVADRGLLPPSIWKTCQQLIGFF